LTASFVVEPSLCIVALLRAFSEILISSATNDGNPVANLALSPCFHQFVCGFIMSITSRIALGLISASLSLHASFAAAQNFDDRWSIIPKAHAEPAPEAGRPNGPTPQPASPAASDADTHAVKQSFSGRASFYSYSKGKTASGAAYDRNSATAAHRTLPFGTKVRVTDIATDKSVIVTITDRGPYTHGRVLDLSRAAAVALGITDEGVVKVRAEVL
jgi:rare lipoprotein A